MKRLNWTLFSAIILACAPSLVSAAVVTQTYVLAQIANNSSFTSGVTTVNLSGPNPSVSLQVGQFLRFGVAMTVTGNPNPAFNGAWDQANQNVNGNPAQPQFLGIGQIGMRFNTGDGTANVVAPVTVPPPAGFTFPQSTASINGSLNFDLSGPGDVLPASGEVGFPSDLGGGYTSANPTTSVGVVKLAAFTAQTNVFTNLKYQGVAPGSTTITQLVNLTPTGFGEVGFWENTNPGTVDGGGNPQTNATYDIRNLNAGSDTFNFLPILTVSVVPEPSAAVLWGMMLLVLIASSRRRCGVLA